MESFYSFVLVVLKISLNLFVNLTHHIFFNFLNENSCILYSLMSLLHFIALTYSV